MTTNSHLHYWNAVRECRRHWRTYAIVCSVALLLAVVTTISTPTNYAARVTIVDESKETDLLIGLSSMQAWLKGKLKKNQGYKDIEIYAHHVMSRAFAEDMSRVKVEGYGMSYAQYLQAHHHRPWWEHLFLSDDDLDPIELINDNIKAEVKTKTFTMRIQVTDQDPVIAAQMADSVRLHLQAFVIGEQRKVAIQQYKNTTILIEQAEKRYREAQREYAAYMDSHQESLLREETTVEKALEQEYNKAYQAFNQAYLQHIRTKAFVNKPNYPFAILKGATVIDEPISPQFTTYLLVFLLIGVICASWSILLKKKYQLLKGGETVWA